MKLLIGVHGKKGSGKDTVAILIAQYVRKELRIEAVVKHYADPLKNGLAAMFGVPIQNFYDENLKEVVIPEIGASPRELMTKMHDLVVPLYGDQVWVRQVKNDYYTWMNNGKSNGVFIVADVRYDVRETDWIRKEGGLIVHVFRDRTDHKAGNHSSERGLIIHDRDKVIHNNKSLLDLRNMVWSDMNDLWKKN